MLYVQYADPAVYPPVEPGAEQFRSLGWDVKFLGVRAAGQLQGLALGEGRSIDFDLRDHKAGGFGALHSFISFWVHAVQRVWREKPDCVYCSDLLSYPAGLLISLTSQAQTILHEHDPPDATPSSAFFRFLKWCRRQFSRSADLCVVPQAERAKRFVNETGSNQVVVVYNCPSLNEVATFENDV